MSGGGRLARLDPSSSLRPGSEGNEPLPDKARPGIGITLLVLDTSMDIDAIVRAFRARGLRSVNTPLATKAQDIVSDWRPRAVVLQAGTPDWSELLRFLMHRDVPTVLLGSSQQLTRAEGQGPPTVHLFMPVEAAEIAEAVELVIGPASARGLPDVVDLGIVSIDLRSRLVEIEERQVDLPPKEFEILVQLALQPGNRSDPRSWCASCGRAPPRPQWTTFTHACFDSEGLSGTTIVPTLSSGPGEVTATCSPCPPRLIRG
jgi:DNA-binding response OmpR family regulator